MSRPLPKPSRVVTHTRMFKGLSKERLRDLALIFILGAAALVYTLNKDHEAVAKGDYYACHTDDCREQVSLDGLNATAQDPGLAQAERDMNVTPAEIAPTQPTK